MSDRVSLRLRIARILFYFAVAAMASTKYPANICFGTAAVVTALDFAIGGFLSLRQASGLDRELEETKAQLRALELAEQGEEDKGDGTVIDV